jgi:hypothetical protein
MYFLKEEHINLQPSSFFYTARLLWDTIGMENLNAQIVDFVEWEDVLSLKGL